MELNQRKPKKRAKIMLPDIRLLINSRATGEYGRNREELGEELIKEIKQLFPKEVPPVRETVIRMISAARNNNPPEDKPWHLDTLKDYPISSKTVGQIFVLKAMGLRIFTIRDAMWLDMLSYLPLPLEVLRHEAQQLSMLQKLQEISDNQKNKDITRFKFTTYAFEDNLVRLISDPKWEWQVHKIAKNEPEGSDVVAVNKEIREEITNFTRRKKIERKHS